MARLGPQAPVLRGLAGGHNGSIALSAAAPGTITFPSTSTQGTVVIALDGLTGEQYRATAIDGHATGTLTIAANGSGKVDLTVPYVVGSEAGFNGTSVHVTGSWTC